MRKSNAMSSRFRSRLDRMAPVMTFGVLLAMLGISGNFTGNVNGPTSGSSIQGVLTRVPGQLVSSTGTWIRSRDVPVPSSQVRLLDLSAHLSVEFLRMGEFPSVTATLFIAYCDEARSMVGHHPPNCYPSSGWLMNVEGTRSLEVVRSDGRIIPAKIYKFSRESSGQKKLYVVSGFFSSGENFSSTLGEIMDVVKPNLLGGSGLFQFQVLLQGEYSDADVKRYAVEILEAIPEVVFDQTIGFSSTTETLIGLEPSHE